MAHLKLVTEQSTHYTELAPALLRLNDFDACFSVSTFLDYSDWKKSVRALLSNYFGLPFHYSVTLSTRSRHFFVDLFRDSYGTIFVKYFEYKIIKD